MSLVEEIRQHWGWVGIKPIEVVGENDLGNFIIKDEDGKYWRLCPEDCYCKIIAANRAELDALSIDQEFLQDWYMSASAPQIELVRFSGDIARQIEELPDGAQIKLRVVE